MRKTEKELFCAYIINQRNRYEAELQERQRRIRYRNIDVDDLVEFLLLRERANAFDEFANTALTLLHLDIHTKNEDGI